MLSSTSLRPRHTPWRVAALSLLMPSRRMGTMRANTRSPILRTSSPRQRAADCKGAGGRSKGHKGSCGRRIIGRFV